MRALYKAFRDLRLTVQLLVELVKIAIDEDVRRMAMEEIEHDTP